MSDYLSICEKAARAGGATLLQWQGRAKVREKAPADLVTEADLASQTTIRDILLGAHPDFDFLGEETLEAEEVAAGARKSAYRWIVDPLDGTTNFVHGMPAFCVSIALQFEREVLVGVVFDPVRGEYFLASAGEGAYLNGKRIRTSDVTRMETALVAASFPPRVAADSPDIARFIAVVQVCQAVRRMGSAALNLCYVAAGRLDAYWATSTKIWDIAAGMLIIREAGGVVTAIDGTELDLSHPRFAAAATESLHAEFVDVLAQAVTPASGSG